MKAIVQHQPAVAYQPEVQAVAEKFTVTLELNREQLQSLVDRTAVICSYPTPDGIKNSGLTYAQWDALARAVGGYHYRDGVRQAV